MPKHHPTTPPKKKLLWEMSTVKALAGLDTVVVCEAPGGTVHPVPCLERDVLLPSAICHTVQASWHLCAPRATQTPACGLFSSGGNVLKMETACQAAFFHVGAGFVCYSRPSLCPNRQMLSGCVCWEVVRLHIQGSWCRLLVQRRSKLSYIGSINLSKSCSVLTIQSD